jgi:hypothetical protein
MSKSAPVLELKEIKFHLSLLTHEIRSKAFGAFEAEVLESEGRQAIWRAFNDNLTPAESSFSLCI